MVGLFASPKGVAEYVPPASAQFVAVRDALGAPARQAGYKYIELAVFEDTELFVRSVGETTDVVGKEMYTFTDRGNRSLTLRPEGTASVVRAAIEHGLVSGTLPLKLWYSGPFFRAERPQLGRYRQFHQVGIEALGSDDPALDAESIALADEALASLGLTDYRLLLNCLGDGQSRSTYRQRLLDYLGGLELDDETRGRAQRNPLRVLDDKRETVQAQLIDAPLMADSLSDASRARHDQVRGYLTDLGIAFQDAPRLVRGLDYYTGTAFELVHDGLGAQSAIGGGGRYDGLVADLGGPELPGIGFALGVDRALLACEVEGITGASTSSCDVFLVPLGDRAKRSLMMVAPQLRSVGVRVDLAFGDRGMKGAMRAADRAQAKLAVLVGDRDLEAGVATIKNLVTGNQVEVTAAGLIDSLQEMLR